MTSCGISGFEFTRPFQAAGLTFRPLYTHPGEAKKFARDLECHHLTGTVSGADLTRSEVAYRLEAVLSFIEHLDVRLRHDFIERAITHLADDAFCDRTKFRLLFIKAAETFRQRKPFMEVSYFLLFSGLEAFARKVQNDYGSNAAGPIARTLKGYGFNVSASNANNLPRAISTYQDIRNAIFHNGELAPTVRLDHRM